MASRKQREAEGLRRRRMAVRKFKALARVVMYNRQWLLEIGEEEQKVSLNAQKNIAMFVRPHRKVGLLTLPDKILLRTHHFNRNVKDRKRLVTLFAGLSCFSTFPPKVRARLVPVATFAQVNKSRYLIKEGGTPIMMYFILYGEVEIYKKVFSPITGKYEDILQGLLGAGDCVGELEFLEDYSYRVNSYVCSMDTELLVVLKDEFDTILKPVMAQQWMDKKSALKALKYFNSFTEIQLVTACKLANIRTFQPLDTIYHVDKGLASYVHFVVSGECLILQCLSIKARVTNGNRTLTLMDVTDDQAAEIFEDLTSKEIMKKLLEENHQDQMIFETDELAAHEKETDKGLLQQPTKPQLINIETLCTKQLHAPEKVVELSKHSTTTEMSAETIRETDGMPKFYSYMKRMDQDSSLLIETHDSEDVLDKQDITGLRKDLSSRIDGGNEEKEDNAQNEKQTFGELGPNISTKEDKAKESSSFQKHNEGMEEETETEVGTSPRGKKETRFHFTNFSKNPISPVVESDRN